MMNNIYDFYSEQLRKADLLAPCHYRVLRYTLGHQQLIIMVESKSDEASDVLQRLFIVFEGVEYMQLFSSWDDASFKPASSTERNSYLEKAKIETTKKSHPFTVFYTSPMEHQYVICSNMYVTEEMPTLYEYTF
jgi:hypothetical protein